MGIRTIESGHDKHIVYVDGLLIGSCRKSEGLWSGVVGYNGFRVEVSGMKTKDKITDLMVCAYELLEKGNG